MQYRNVCTVTSTSSNGQDGRVGRTNSHPVRKFPGHAFGRKHVRNVFLPTHYPVPWPVPEARAGGCLQLVRDDEANASSYFGVNVLLAAVVR